MISWVSAVLVDDVKPRPETIGLGPFFCDGCDELEDIQRVGDHDMCRKCRGDV